MMNERRCRILLVDDDPMVVRGLTRTLQPRYDVVGLTDPTAALTLLAARDEVFDLVISDVVMPGVDSRQFCLDLAQAWPRAQTRTLFLTGLMDPDDLRQQVPGLPGQVLQKPIETQKLLDIIAALLRAEVSA